MYCHTALCVNIYSQKMIIFALLCTAQVLGMEDEDAEMAKAIAKSEEEEEQRLQSELRREGKQQTRRKVGVEKCVLSGISCLKWHTLSVCFKKIITYTNIDLCCS